MTKMIFDISISLDGFMTATNVRPEEPLGDAGQLLHEWAMGDEDNRKYLEEAATALGAGVAGRRTYDTSVPWWGADVLSVTNVYMPPSGVSAGTESGLEQPKAAAGGKGVSA